jgi:photosystem II stability/assembly factor-like uncharacterized protein
MSRARLLIPFLTLFFAALPIAAAQKEDEPEWPVDPALYQAMQWRNVGPHRGGRVVAVAGVADDPHLYYMGATGGGVWTTANAGTTWANISDEFFETGSVGAIAVAPSDPNVIYVGTGEGPIRGVTTSHGDGVYRSTDAGESWTNVGLAEVRQIPVIRVHPKNPDLVYVAAQGNPWGPNPERGIYRSKDGGESWEHVLKVDETTGACDLSMDPTNPRILFAAMWDHRRKPWQVRSGGPGSGIYKSTDGGDTWEKLTKGLPELMGKIGIAVSPARAKRVWALIEAENGGLYRSDDRGKSWRLINTKRVLRARSWYYMHVVADPQDENTVYVLNGPAVKSIDGGETFERFRAPHGDHHALWINPNDNRWMVEGNDGGANVSLDGGASWSTQYNQPTAQFYRVIADNRFPYYLYAGQQDNTTVAIASRSEDQGIGRDDWHPVAGGESAHVAFDPDDPRLVYATSIMGFVTEYDQETKTERGIQVYPEMPLGSSAAEVRYRFNWNPPIIASPHDSRVLYYGAHVLLRSTDRGLSWDEISPDLTRNEREKHGPGGVPITDEAAGAEHYNTIFYIVESPHEAGTIWIGTDDGLVQLTRDGGETWNDVTPRGLGEVLINAIDVSSHDPATAWIAATGYKLNDFTPRIYKTENYGKSWTERVAGIPDGEFVRVVREDPVREGLVFAGTEQGVWVSFDDGGNWQPLQLELPHVPVTDMRVHGDDLVASTQGRAFWILDGLGPLRQIESELADAGHHLFTPDPAYRLGGTGEFVPQPGQNPPDGVVVYSWFKEEIDPEAVEVEIEIVGSDGSVIRSFSNRKNEVGQCYWDNAEFHGPEDEPYGLLTLKQGMNRLVWNFQRENVECIPGHFALGWDGPRVAPGEYTARLRIGDEVQEVRFEVLADPRLDEDVKGFAEQQALVLTAYGAVNELHRAVRSIDSARAQIERNAELAREGGTAEAINRATDAYLARLAEWEAGVIQRKRETQQDIIAFPNLLGMQLRFLMGVLDQNDTAITKSSRERLDDLLSEWSRRLEELAPLLGRELDSLNEVYEENDLPAVFLPIDRATKEQIL